MPARRIPLLSRGEYYALVIAEFRAAKSTITSGKIRKIPCMFRSFRYLTCLNPPYFVAEINIHHKMLGQ
jgi:hypothetical protein